MVAEDFVVGVGGRGIDSLASQTKVLPMTHPRCNVSSELCCPGTKPRRWAPPLVSRCNSASIMIDIDSGQNSRLSIINPKVVSYMKEVQTPKDCIHLVLFL